MGSKARKQAPDETVAANPAAVERIRELNAAADAAILKRDEFIEAVAVGAGLTVKNGEEKWSYLVASGAFHRPSQK